MQYSAQCRKRQMRNSHAVIVTFLAGYNFLLKLKAQIVEMVSMPVLKKHLSGSYLEYKQQGNLHHQQKRPKQWQVNNYSTYTIQLKAEMRSAIQEQQNANTCMEGTWLSKRCIWKGWADCQTLSPSSAPKTSRTNTIIFKLEKSALWIR